MQLETFVRLKKGVPSSSESYQVIKLVPGKSSSHCGGQIQCTKYNPPSSSEAIDPRRSGKVGIIKTVVKSSLKLTDFVYDSNSVLEEPSPVLIITGFPMAGNAVTRSYIESRLSDFGDIEEITLARNPSNGIFLGFAMVRFKRWQEARMAVLGGGKHSGWTWTLDSKDAAKFKEAMRNSTVEPKQHQQQKAKRPRREYSQDDRYEGRNERRNEDRYEGRNDNRNEDRYKGRNDNRRRNDIHNSDNKNGHRNQSSQILLRAKSIPRGIEISKIRDLFDKFPVISMDPFGQFDYVITLDSAESAQRCLRVLNGRPSFFGYRLHLEIMRRTINEFRHQHRSHNSSHNSSDRNSHHSSDRNSFSNNHNNSNRNDITYSNGNIMTEGEQGEILEDSRAEQVEQIARLPSVSLVSRVKVATAITASLPSFRKRPASATSTPPSLSPNVKMDLDTNSNSLASEYSEGSLLEDPGTSEAEDESLEPSGKGEHAAKHATGSARSEGFYKIPAQTKAQYLSNVRIPAAVTMTVGQENVAASNPNINTNSTSRQSRLIHRQLKTSLTAATTSDILQFSDLKSRSKRLAFGKSLIHDWGLFSMQDIEPQEMVIEYIGECISCLVAELREVRYTKMGIGSSYLFRVDRYTVIDATKMGNLARFINHSCDPNCHAQIISIRNQKKIVFYAKRAIAEGEEITYDYKFPLEDEKIPCLCGAPNCRRTLN